MMDAVNNVLGSPVIATDSGYETILTTKWRGLTANDTNVTIETNGNALGLTYAVNSTQSGSGTPSVTAALSSIGSQWATIVLNTYGTNSTILSSLESYNGKPDATNPTGRYAGTIFKPFIAVTGSTIEDPSSLTDGRLNEVTIAIAPAPLSSGYQFEAAANMSLLFALQAQNSPQLDVSGQSYPDMPTPTSIGAMSEYDNRDTIVKKGCSTVILNGGQYQVNDFVTTYHPIGELPPQFRYCRNLNLDWNVRYGYFLLEQNNVVDHVIANDQDIVTASRVIKPKQWKGILDNYATSLSQRALITDPAFMQDSITVDLSSTNPDRLETFFRYKRTGFARISDTVAEAGFNFGN
jgi:phage tail sheath gpL-like